MEKDMEKEKNKIMMESLKKIICLIKFKNYFNLILFK